MAVLAIKDIKVDVEGFRKIMKQFSIAFNKMGGAVVKQQAAMLADDLLDYTLPVVGTGGPDAGRTNAARDVGRLVVQKNIESIFKPLHEARYEDIASNGDYSVFVAWAADRRNHNKKMGVKGDNLNENGWAAFQFLRR
jgi:hypothetical protein